MRKETTSPTYVALGFFFSRFRKFEAHTKIKPSQPQL